MIKLINLQDGMKVLAVKNTAKGSDVKKFLKENGYNFYLSLSDRPISIETVEIDGDHIRLDGELVDNQIEVNMSQDCLVGKVRNEFSTRISGRSGFAARNRLIITDTLQETTAVAIELSYPGIDASKEAREIVGDKYDPEAGWGYIVEELKETSVSFEDYSSINQRINELKEECLKEYSNKFSSEFGSIINGVEIGPNEKFDRLPDDYVIIHEELSKRTADHRQGKSHTYRVWAVQKGYKGVPEIKLPEGAPKGKIIGKGGSNIKELAKQIGCKFIKLA